MNDERRKAFEQLFAAHYWALRAYVLRRSRSVSVEDVLADAFLVAWRRLDAVPDDALPWLIAVARRTLANHLRAERRSRALTQRLVVAGAHMPAWDPPAGLSDELRAALASLPAREREALLLVAWDGLEPRRAARAAGCTPAAFRVRLYRARKHVSPLLRAPVADPPYANTTEGAS
jgi:RNA polymerase sigma-70 factor, ECF subfamily